MQRGLKFFWFILLCFRGSIRAPLQNFENSHRPCADSKLAAVGKDHDLFHYLLCRGSEASSRSCSSVENKSHCLRRRLRCLITYVNGGSFVLDKLSSAKKLPERTKEAVWQSRGFLGKTLQLVGEFHLLAAMYFARDCRNLIGRQIDFIGGSCRLTSSGSQVI